MTELKADKGLQNGSCNLTACQKAGANYFNKSTMAYYCKECADEINWIGGRKDTMRLYGVPLLCEYVDPNPSKLEPWQPMNTAPKDRHILVKWQTSVIEAVWLKHRNSFCVLSGCLGSFYSPIEYDWLEGWQESTLAKIEELDQLALNAGALR